MTFMLWRFKTTSHERLFSASFVLKGIERVAFASRGTLLEAHRQHKRLRLMVFVVLRGIAIVVGTAVVAAPMIAAAGHALWASTRLLASRCVVCVGQASMAI